jgi:hypothetical protein
MFKSNEGPAFQDGDLMTSHAHAHIQQCRKTQCRRLYVVNDKYSHKEICSKPGQPGVCIVDARKLRSHCPSCHAPVYVTANAPRACACHHPQKSCHQFLWRSHTPWLLSSSLRPRRSAWRRDNPACLEAVSRDVRSSNHALQARAQEMRGSGSGLASHHCCHSFLSSCHFHYSPRHCSSCRCCSCSS